MSCLQHLQNGRYTILKKLGEGGRGIVYKVRDTTLDRVVAIKMLKSEVLTEEILSRFMREAQAVAKLNHPNIVSIYDIGKEDAKHFLVLEFIDGMSLRVLLETYPEGKCDLQTVLRISMDICEALKYAHSQGVLHRDIKPENIMINEFGIAKLMDFGLAKILGQPGVTREGIIVGTVAYVAPEIALGKSADARSDLYSYGAVLYEMVCGRPPFTGEDPLKVIFGHVHDYPISPSRLNPKIPQPLVECIMKLLQKEPEKRYQSAADLLAALKIIAQTSLEQIASSPTQTPSITISSVSPLSIIGEIQLVDRAEEMKLLREAVDRVIRQERGLVFLCGEAGIGKTRLARELASYARLRGMQVLSGRCPALFRMGGVLPYVLWKDVIRDCFVTRTPEQLFKIIGFYPSEISKLAPELRQKLGTFPESPPIGPEQERERLFEAVLQFVENVSKESPLLLVLDDLQWADPSSLLLVHYLAQGVRKEPLLVLGAYRNTDVDDAHPLSPILAELNRERLLQSVELKRMPFDDVQETVKRILEKEDVPKEFCELVYEKTKGNPFFVEEVIRSLREEGVIYRDASGWEIGEVTKIEFPKTVKSIIKTRLNRLDDECQNVLTTASFIGNDFTFKVLHEATSIEEDKLLELMEETIKAGFVKERVIRGEDMYSFTDVMIRDVVHEEVSLLRHKRLHNLVGCTIEKVYANKIDEHLGELAYHFLEGGDKDKALTYFLKAGEKAQKVYAHDEAFSYLRHALSLLEEKKGPVEEQIQLLTRLGDLKTWMGENNACIEYLNRAITLCHQIRDNKGVARLHAKMAFVYWQFIGDKEKASEHHHMALEILEKEPESVELAALYEDISHMLWRSGKSFSESLFYAKKAFELAQRFHALEVLSHCFIDLMVLSMKSGEYDNTVEYHEQGLKIALENDFITDALTQYNNMVVNYSSMGQFQKMFETSQKGSELARKAGALYSRAWLDLNLAQSYGQMGEVKKAISIAEEIMALDKRIKYKVHLPMVITGLGWGYRILGEWERSLEYLMVALHVADEVGEYQLSSYVNVELGELHMEKGDYAQAEKYMKEAVRIDETAGDMDSKFGTDFPPLSRLYLKRGEVEKAKELMDETHEHAIKVDSKLLISRVGRLRGILFRQKKDWEESIRHFEVSLQGYKSMQAEKWNVIEFADLLYEYGLMYLEKNGEGDKEKAFLFLDQAMEIYQKVDAKKRIEETIAKKKLLTA